MELKNKVMKLYEDVLEPVKARKLVLLLKYVIVDGETELNKITNEINIGKRTIEEYVDNDSLMLNYLSETEIKIFRLKIDNILEKNQKLIKLIKLILVKNETDLEKIEKTIPVNIETIKKYVDNKQKLLRYLTNEELETFLNRINPILEKTNSKLERLIKVVLVDGETDLDKIEKKAYIKIGTIKKHIEDTRYLEMLLDQEQLTLFVNKVKKMFEDRELQEYETEVRLVRQIINDILDTRYIYADICAKGLSSVKKFEKYLYDEEFMKREFPGVKIEEIKNKIDENYRIRLRKPRDMFIVEDKFCVMITKKDVHYLNQYDMKKLNVASHYIGTGANMKSVLEYFKIELPEALAILSSKKLEQILDEKYYIILKQCLSLENILNGNELDKRKELVIKVANLLEQNNYDTNLVMMYLQIPEPLFNKILDNIVKLPYASDETKQTIKNMLYMEKENKSKK